MELTEGASAVSSAEFAKILAQHGLSYSDAADIVSFLADIPYERLLPVMSNALLPANKALNVLSLLRENVPVAYITGRKEFYGHEFIVTPDTLIPRPETETLVENVLSHVKVGEEIFILDLYTGSGCILLTLLKELADARGTGIDISDKALSVAGQNAVKLGISDRVDFNILNILDEDFSNFIPADGRCIVTANPPYVSPAEYRECEPSVLYEPRDAIVADEEGYIHHRKLLYTLPKLGNNNVRLYMEIGASQGQKVQEIAEQVGIKTALLSDLAGHDRLIIAEKAAIQG